MLMIIAGVIGAVTAGYITRRFDCRPSKVVELYIHSYGRYIDEDQIYVLFVALNVFLLKFPIIPTIITRIYSIYAELQLN